MYALIRSNILAMLFTGLFSLVPTLTPQDQLLLSSYSSGCRKRRKPPYISPQVLHRPPVACLRAQSVQNDGQPQGSHSYVIG